MRRSIGTASADGRYQAFVCADGSKDRVMLKVSQGLFTMVGLNIVGLRDIGARRNTVA